MIRPLLVLALLSLAVPAWPCSVVGPLPSAERLVGDAEVIARVRVEGLSSALGDADPVLAGSPTKVQFAVLELLKGNLPSSTIEFNGSVTNRDDRNDRPVPYDFVRPQGRGGNCFALAYRAGAEYLLLLRRVTGSSGVQSSELTPVLGASQPHERTALRRHQRRLVRLGQQSTAEVVTYARSISHRRASTVPLEDTQVIREDFWKAAAERDRARWADDGEPDLKAAQLVEHFSGLSRTEIKRNAV